MNFQRNLGLVSEEEQRLLGEKTVAIAGMGGVGGAHLVNLVRMGVKNLRIADPDTFEPSNMNRQYGATVKTLGKNKAKVMNKIVRKINPQARVEAWESRIKKHNCDLFLKDSHLFLDGIDAFNVKDRRDVSKRALEMGIPVVTGGPIGFSGCVLTFLPGDDYDGYFGFKNDEMDVARFFAGLCPSFPKVLKYLDVRHVKNGAGPCLSAAVNLASTMVLTEAIKILLDRGSIVHVPRYQLFDTYLGTYKRGKLGWWNRWIHEKKAEGLWKKLRARLDEHKECIFL